jgi:hypothetical protein
MVATIRLLPTGHFALEADLEETVSAMCAFLAKYIQ